MKWDNETPFVFYPSFRTQLKAIKNSNVKAVILEALIDYGICGEIPDFSDIDPLGTIDALFIPMQQEIDKAKARYFARVENGKKGGAPKGNRNAAKSTENNLNQPRITKDNQEQPKSTENNLDIDIDKDIYKENTPLTGVKESTKRTAFVPPSLDEISAYISEKGYSVDAERFFNFYESKGWMVGKTKMKKWKNAVANWEKDEKEKSSGKKERATPQPGKPIERNYDEGF